MKLIIILLLLGVLALPASASEIISGGNIKTNATILEWSPQATDYVYVNSTVNGTIEYYITTAESITVYNWSVDGKPVDGDVDGNIYFYTHTWDNDSIGFHKVNFKGNNSGTKIEFQWYVNVYEIEGYRGGELFDVMDNTLENHYAQIKIRMFKDKIAKHGSNSAIAVQMVNQLHDEIAKRQMTLEDLKIEFKAGNITIEEDVAALKRAQLDAKYNAKIAKEMANISKEVIKDEDSGKKFDKLLEIENDKDQERKDSETQVKSNVTIKEDHIDTSEDVKDEESGEILKKLLEIENDKDQERKDSETQVKPNVTIKEDHIDTLEDVKDEESGEILKKLLEIENKLDQERKDFETHVRYNVAVEDYEDTVEDHEDTVEDDEDTVEGNMDEGSENKYDKSPEKVNTDDTEREESATHVIPNVTVETTETANATVEPTETANETVETTETANETVEPTETANETVEPTETANETVEPTETANETVEPTETYTETVESTETYTETVESTETYTETVEPTETYTETVEPTETYTETVESTETYTETVEPTETVESTETVEENNKDTVAGNQSGDITIEEDIGVVKWAQLDGKYNSEFTKETAKISKVDIQDEELGNQSDKLLETENTRDQQDANTQGKDKGNDNQTQE